jgi:hypothetical protein
MPSNILNNIVSISGRKSSGKSACAAELQKIGYSILNVADALKDLIRKVLFISKDILEENKNNPDLVFTLDNFQVYLLSTEIGIHHETIQSVLFVHSKLTIRLLLQLIGTDLIRSFNPNWHLEKLKENVQQLQLTDPNCKICIPDVRFKNELEFIKNELQGESYYMIRQLGPQQQEPGISNHVSETELNWSHFGNNVIINDCTLEELMSKLMSCNSCNQLTELENKMGFLKSRLFLNVDFRNVYLAGKLFLNTKANGTLTPFINENYKLWYCSNKRYPDILENINDEQLKAKYIRLWFKGIFDFMVQSSNKLYLSD